MKKEHTKLMDKIIQSLDWDSIYEINKVLKMGVGMGSEVIPGVKKKPFSESLTKADFKAELKSLIKHAMKNHIPQLNYGNWIIYWVSDEWDIDVHYPDELDDDDIDEESGEDDDFVFYLEPQLEIIFAPQRISLVGEISRDLEEQNENLNLEEMLEKAIQKEDYELASKIRDLISQNKEKKLDK